MKMILVVGAYLAILTAAHPDLMVKVYCSIFILLSFAIVARTLTVVLKPLTSWSKSK